VLQTVIGQNDVGTLIYQYPGSARPISRDTDETTRATSDNYWFIADLDGIARRRYHDPVFLATTPIAPADDPGPVTGTREPVSEPDHDRRFAGSADGQIANNNDRHWQSFLPAQPDSIGQSS
jgi:hypothetical protein